MNKTYTQREIEEVLARVEAGETTVADADFLRGLINSYNQTINQLFGSDGFIVEFADCATDSYYVVLDA